MTNQCMAVVQSSTSSENFLKGKSFLILLVNFRPCQTGRGVGDVIKVCVVLPVARARAASFHHGSLVIEW